MKHILVKSWFPVLLILLLVSSCQAIPLVVDESTLTTSEATPPLLTQAETDTLRSLEQIDPYPLYTMEYLMDYEQQVFKVRPGDVLIEGFPPWGCSLFAVFGDPEEMLFGRNFDWDFSPGLLLYTNPPEGYSSVSMVDLHYLGFGGEDAFGLTDLPLEDRTGLLDAPLIPFDGMNEAGLAIGMAAVPPGGMEIDPGKPTIDSVMVIRKILDEAATVEEGVEIIKSYNIDWENGPPLHYLIADHSGKSALVEFSQGEVVVIPNTESWQPATNFLVSEVGDSPEDQCWRYQTISHELMEKRGVLTVIEAMGLLKDVAQESTQWSIVYDISNGAVNLVMGGEYDRVHHSKINPD